MGEAFGISCPFMHHQNFFTRLTSKPAAFRRRRASLARGNNQTISREKKQKYRGRKLSFLALEMSNKRWKIRITTMSNEEITAAAPRTNTVPNPPPTIFYILLFRVACIYNYFGNYWVRDVRSEWSLSRSRNLAFRIQSLFTWVIILTRPKGGCLTWIPSLHTKKSLSSTTWVVTNCNVVECTVTYGIDKRIEESKWRFASSNSGIIQQGNNTSECRGRGGCATDQACLIPEYYFKIVCLRWNIRNRLNLFVRERDKIRCKH